MKVRFKGGATRNNIGKVRFDLIDPYGMRRLAAVYHEGATIHGDRNWEAGMPTHDIMNHMEHHRNLYMQGDRSEDHIAKIAWGCFAIMRMEAKHKELCDLPKDM
jgi:hypothetical protein